MPRYNEPPTASEMEADCPFEPEIVDLIVEERERQIKLAHGGDTNEFDRRNTKNDWVAYITAYAGRAAEKVGRNERQGEGFSDNLIKVAALCIAALEAEQRGWC